MNVPTSKKNGTFQMWWRPNGMSERSTTPYSAKASAGSLVDAHPEKASMARPTGGESSTGLGLAIVKDLVALHGGNVRAESEGIGRGATFFVELPRLLHPPLRLAPAANETDPAHQRAG